MATIYSVKPNLPRSAAIRMLRGKTAFKIIQQIWPGQLRTIADAYIPLRIFRTEIRDAAKTETACFGIDAVEGSMDLVQFEGSSDLIELQTRNWVGPILDESKLKAKLIDEVRRLAYQRGFFSLSDLEIRAEALSFGIFAPYWVGFYGTDGSLRSRVLDAVRCEPAGPRVHSLIDNWLRRKDAEADEQRQNITIVPSTPDFSYEAAPSVLNPIESRTSAEGIRWRLLSQNSDFSEDVD
jgi:hypothetical protein